MRLNMDNNPNLKVLKELHKGAQMGVNALSYVSEKVREKGFKILKEHLSPIELIEFLQIISNGTGDYTKEKYEGIEELTIEDFEQFLEEN